MLAFFVVFASVTMATGALSTGRMAGWASRWLTDELTALAKQGQWKAALKTLESIQESSIVTRNVFHYTTVISACGKAKQCDAALKTFQLMLKNGVQPNVFTYTALISACSAVAKADLALSIFAKMKQDDIVPNIRTLSALTTACARAGMWQKCVALVEGAESMLLVPNVFTFSSAIDGCRRCGKWEECIKLLDLMQEKYGVEPNDVVFNNVIHACGSAQQKEPAQQIFARMRAAGYVPVSFTKASLEMAFEGSELKGVVASMEIQEKQVVSQQ